MRALLLFLPGATLAATAALPSATGDDEEWTPAEIRKTFVESCRSCHVPPDTSFATDRAWVDQIERTS